MFLLIIVVWEILLLLIELLSVYKEPHKHLLIGHIYLKKKQQQVRGLMFCPWQSRSRRVK